MWSNFREIRKFTYLDTHWKAEKRHKFNKFQCRNLAVKGVRSNYSKGSEYYGDIPPPPHPSKNYIVILSEVTSSQAQNTLWVIALWDIALWTLKRLDAWYGKFNVARTDDIQPTITGLDKYLLHGTAQYPTKLQADIWNA